MPRGGSTYRRGGRQKGTPNKATAELRAYASQYTEEAIEGLLTIGRNGEASAQARVAAWVAILDRAHGKPAQALTGPDGGPLETREVRFVDVRSR